MKEILSYEIEKTNNKENEVMQKERYKKYAAAIKKQKNISKGEKA